MSAKVLVSKVRGRCRCLKADLSCRLTPQTCSLGDRSCMSTQGIFNDEAFSKIKKGARVVNVARGGVIDDEALCRALDSGKVAQAALDVFSKEPPTGNPLVGRPDVICTPHLGASTVEAQEDVAVEIAEAVVEALQVETSRPGQPWIHPPLPTTNLLTSNLDHSRAKIKVTKQCNARAGRLSTISHQTGLE